ncbi:MAG: heavy-metal-associated domain-containing protein [Kiritimatiellae bacterium]|nr:heavy-metal-associated domain-containing protein [Kiritimatiellia bacterium]
MRHHLLLLSAAIFAICGACFRADIQRHEIHVPDLATVADATLIRAALLTTTDTSAVHRVEVDLADHRVTITYDSRRTARRNLEHAIADAGFHANDLPPAPRRRMAATPPPSEPKP